MDVPLEAAYIRGVVLWGVADQVCDILQWGAVTLDGWSTCSSGGIAVGASNSVLFLLLYVLGGERMRDMVQCMIFIVQYNWAGFGPLDPVRCSAVGSYPISATAASLLCAIRLCEKQRFIVPEHLHPIAPCAKARSCVCYSSHCSSSW